MANPFCWAAKQDGSGSDHRLVPPSETVAKYFHYKTMLSGACNVAILTRVGVVFSRLFFVKTLISETLTKIISGDSAKSKFKKVC